MLSVSCTLRDPSEAVLTGVQRPRKELAIDRAPVTQFTHATTECSNTILQCAGARAALLTTAGFRDVLEIQRYKRYSLLDQHHQKTAPLVPRRLCMEAMERVAANGDVVTPLDESALRVRLQQLAAEKSMRLRFFNVFISQWRTRAPCG